jgi:hypothetical protein
MAVTWQRAQPNTDGDDRPVDLPSDAVPHLTYDRSPDILLLTFFGPDRPHVVRYVSDRCGLLIDPVDGSVVGVEIDDVLAVATAVDSTLLAAVAAAEYTGMTNADRALLPTALPFAAAVQAVLDAVNDAE